MKPNISALRSCIDNIHFYYHLGDWRKLKTEALWLGEEANKLLAEVDKHTEPKDIKWVQQSLF